MKIMEEGRIQDVFITFKISKRRIEITWQLASERKCQLSKSMPVKEFNKKV